MVQIMKSFLLPLFQKTGMKGKMVFRRLKKLFPRLNAWLAFMATMLALLLKLANGWKAMASN